MAFTSTPETQTQATQRLPVIHDMEFQPGTSTTNFNQGMINIVPIKVGKEMYGESRYSISANDVTTANAAIQYTCRGMYVWEKTIGTIYYFVVVNDSLASTSKVYSSTDRQTWTAVNTLGTFASGPVRFTEFIDATNTKKLVMVDGVEGYVFTSNAAGTKIVDVDFPTPHVPFPVFIDGYLFLAKADTGDIYNSDLNDPAVWTAGNFISSELYPDDVQAVLKIDNYLVAVGTQGTEYFYNAGTATGSPLARISEAALSFGTPFPNTIAYSKDSVMMLANSNDGSASLRLIQGTKSTQIRCPFIDAIWVGFLNNNSSWSASYFRGWFFRHNGALCYALSFDGVQTSIGDSASNAPTYVYNVDLDIWTEFQTGTQGNCFPVYFSASTTSNSTVNYVAGHWNKNGTSTRVVFFGVFNSAPIALGGSSIGSLALSDVVVTYGGGANSSYTSTFVQKIKTSVSDFGSLNLKTCTRFGIAFVSNQVGGTTPTFTVAWYDIGVVSSYGGYTGSTTTNSPDIFVWPFVTQLGNFRQRIFVVSTSDVYPIRWKFFEVEINRLMH